MPMFYYRAADAAGKLIQGNLEARQEKLVVQHLQQGGLIPLLISREAEILSGKPRPLIKRRPRVSLAELVHFTQELAALLKAGLPLERSLQALQETTKQPGLKSLFNQLTQDLQSGKSLSEALSRQKVFSPLYISMIQAGETGGFLEEALWRLGDYLKTVREFRGYILTALIYPMILAIVGGLSIVLMLLYVVPKFESLFKDLGQTLFWSTQILLTVSRAFRNYWWVLVLLGAALGLFAINVWRRPQARLWLDRLKLSAPLMGDLTRKVAAAFYAKTLGTLINSGVPLVTAFQVAAKAVTNRHLTLCLSRTLEDVKKGQPLSKLLKKLDLFPELFLQMIAVGEETGHLAEMLLSAAEFLENDARAHVRRLLALLEPLLLLVMALVVSFIIVSLMMPILNLYEISL
jgi:general secretion pathway protein F